MKNFDCVIVSVHLKATGLGNEDLERLQKEIDKVPNIVQAIGDHFPGMYKTKTFTVDPHLSGHLCSQDDCPDNWISG